MDEKQLNMNENAKPSRRTVVKGSLIALGAAMLLQPKGGVAQDAPKDDDGKKKKGKKKKSEEPKKD